MSRLLLKNLAFAALLVMAAVALYLLAARHPLQVDLTQSASNSLEDGSVAVLRQMPGEIRLTVFSTREDAEMGDIRKLIRNFVALYQRYKPDIALDFVDPTKHPDEARKAGIQANGEMRVEYAGRSEHLTLLNEPSLTGALLRLAHGKDKLLMYLDGHGERKLDGIANHDLGEFGKRLQQNGYRIASLNLAIAQDVPANASVLVVTQPQVDLLPGETDKLLRYVDGGGNLLWLIDAEPMRGLQPLAEKIGLQLTPGIVIDPAAEEMRAPAEWALGSGYPPHAITHNFDLITVFPFARALGWEGDEEWQRTTLVEAAPRGWVSARRTEGAPRFDKNRDTPGPVAVALALQRDVNDREQRIVVVGSGSFLANMYSGNGGNLDLGLDMVNWLADEEKFIAIPPHAAKDASVTLSRTRLNAIAIGTSVVLPLLLLVAAGGVLWWRRRR